MNGFDPSIPIERATTPPARWYTDPQFLELENSRVFRPSWQPVARIEELSKPGDYVAGSFLGTPYVVVRGGDGGLRAFHNTCRHHAARICSPGAGKVQELVCPYHGWTYSLEGALRAAPRMKGAQCFEHSELSLFPLRAEIWGRWVWLTLDPGAKALAGRWPELQGRLDESGAGALAFHSRKTYEIACNWKVYVDNYLDGGYHVPVLHRGLAAQLDLGSYRTETFDGFSIQSCRGRSKGRIGREALYAWIYPGFMINRYGPAMDTNWVIPISADRTLTVFDFYFEPGSSEDFIAESIGTSEAVQREDVSISESVQAGLRGGAYQVGRYAPDVEQGEHHFHRLLARDLRS